MHALVGPARWWLSIAGFLALHLAVLPGAAQAQLRELHELRACVAANLPQVSVSQRVRLVSRDTAGGSRELDAMLYAARQSAERISLMLDVRGPSDLAGARYLLIERAQADDMFVFLPAVARTRRVVGGMRGQPLWGTDFSYEDIKRLQSAIVNGQAELVGRVVSQGRSAHSLALRPAPAAESAYKRVELDIDDQTCLLLTVRFFDAAGLVKRMNSDPASFRQAGKRWFMGRVTMHNLRAGTESELVMETPVYDQKLSNALFHPSTFHQAR